MRPQRALWRIAKTKAETLDLRFGSRCAFLTRSDLRSLFTRIHRIPSYNQAGLLTQTTNAMGHPATYAYDAANELTSSTDADGRTITYAYDQAGRMTGKTWVGGSYTATFVYNKDGLATEAEDPNSVYTYAYNADSQVTSVDNAGTSSVPTVTLSLAYDGYQNLTSVSDSLGGSLSYGYNSDNQLSSLALSVSSTMDAQVTFAYDSANRLTGLTRTGVSGSIAIVSTLSYDNADRLTNITDSKKSTTLANYTYAYNKGGELTSYQDNSGNSLTYGYDPDGELTGATGTLLSQSYTFTYDYDKNGNRTTTVTDIGGSLTTSAYSTGSGNELKNDGTYTYTYDNDGNMATQTNLTTGSVTYYSWDYANRLTEAKEETSSGTVIYDEKYTYDVNSNRIGVSNNGTQELYTVYLGSNPYIDFNGSGTLTERYLFNPQSLNVFYGQVSNSGTTEWFLTDNINSIRQVVSTTGSVLDAITYDPYGNILNQTSTTYEPRFLYAGGAYDSNTGMYQDGAREDDPLDGRWISQDPLGFAAGDANLYGYAFNAPAYLCDPSGLWSPNWNRVNNGLDVLTGGLSTKVLNSQWFGSTFDKVDSLFAGWGNTLTAGGVTSVRAYLWGESATRNHGGTWYNVGQGIGFVHNLALMAVNPCSLSGTISTGLKGINAIQAVSGIVNAGNNFRHGNYVSGVLNLLGVAGNVGQLLKACFAAGTPLLTPDGDKPIEQFKPGDWVLSASEFDPEAPPEPRQVEEVFIHVSPLLHLVVDGQTIQTTSEHPFFVRGKGWTATKDLKTGDLLRSHDGQWVAVQAMTEGEGLIAVYNLRVAEHHTYFVGSRDWSFSVWAHNSYGGVWDSSAGRWRDPVTGKFMKPPPPGAVGAGEGSQALEQLEGIARAQQRIRSGSDRTGRIIDSVEGSRQTVRNQLNRPYEPSDWE